MNLQFLMEAPRVTSLCFRCTGGCSYFWCLRPPLTPRSSSTRTGAGSTTPRPALTTTATTATSGTLLFARIPRRRTCSSTFDKKLTKDCVYHYGGEGFPGVCRPGRNQSSCADCTSSSPCTVIIFQRKLNSIHDVQVISAKVEGH
jgi:hypothetical protein